MTIKTALSLLPLFGVLSAVPMFAQTTPAQTTPAPAVTAPTAKTAKVKHAHKNLLEKYDANHDGMISKTEWKGKATRFDKLDANHDGNITAEELAAHPKKK